MDGERADSNRFAMRLFQVTLDRRPAVRAKIGEERSATAHDTVGLFQNCWCCRLPTRRVDEGCARPPGRMFRGEDSDNRVASTHMPHLYCYRGRKSPAGIEPATTRLSFGNPAPSARNTDEGRRGKRSTTELRAFPSCSCMEPAGIEPATSRVIVDNPPPSARNTDEVMGRESALPAELRPLTKSCPAVWVARRNVRPSHRESRVHVLGASRPPTTLHLTCLFIVVCHLPAAVNLQTKNAPPGRGAGGAIVSLPGPEKATRSRRASSRYSHAGNPVPAAPNAAVSTEATAPSAERAPIRTPPTGARRPREERVRPRIRGESV